ncbi:MAG: tetratricopeptide repeat protein, partial [Thermoplasmata archaeon]|nr:tetratricopeptide repeat protein [Thermoplasmata archaeon]
MTRCSKCSTENPPGSSECSNCGAALVGAGGGLIGGGSALGGGALERKRERGSASLSVGPTTYGDGVSFVSTGDAMKQLQAMTLEGMDAQQLENIANQLNLLMNQMGVVAEYTKGGDMSISAKDRQVVDMIEQKVKEVEEKSGKLLASPEAYLRLGNYYYSRGKHELALENYDKALKLQSDVWITWYNKGCVLQELDRHEEAVPAYKRATDLNDDAVEAWYNMGVANM